MYILYVLIVKSYTMLESYTVWRSNSASSFGPAFSLPSSDSGIIEWDSWDHSLGQWLHPWRVASKKSLGSLGICCMSMGLLQNHLMGFDEIWWDHFEFHLGFNFLGIQMADLMGFHGRIVDGTPLLVRVVLVIKIHDRKREEVLSDDICITIPTFEVLPT